MRYLGGKTRISKWVAENVILAGAGKTHYIEPFVGSGATFVKISPWFPKATASDCHPDLILMWQALASGWVPPDFVSKEEYLQLKSSEPSALRGFVGFGNSYRGIWFSGYSSVHYDSYWRRDCKPQLLAAKKSVMRDSSVFTRASVLCCDYSDHAVDSSCVVYCDPPYKGTASYKGVPSFDSDKFWGTAEAWSKTGAVVVVSEESAPNGWHVLSARTRKAFLKRQKDGTNDVREEKLFIRE